MSSVADLVVARLRDAGVQFLFGMPGGGSNLDLIDAAARAGVPFVLTATETAGAIAALAQAEITGRPGACLTTLGPGVASAVNGVACAHLERAPLVVFTDAPATGDDFEHQRLDHRALLAPVTKWSATIAVDNADVVVRHAIDCAMADPRGPVHIDCPAEVLSRKSQVFSRESQVVSRESPLVEPVPSTEDLRLPTEDCVRPLFLLGLGARAEATAAAIRALCASHRVPAMVTYKAKGVVADSDAWFAGVFTNGAVERPMLDRADLILAVGLDPVELLPRPWPDGQPVVRMAPSQIEGLAAQLRPSSWDLHEVQRLVVRQRDAVRIPTAGLAPHRVVESAAAAAPHARVTVDAGAHMFLATMLWPVAAPNGMLISNGLSTMGFALPAAVGAALLDRASPVIVLTGDGGLLMCAGELVTAAREGLQVIVIVFNDRTLSLIDVKRKRRRLARSGVDVGAIDWRALAESVGVCAKTATTEGDLADVLAAALQRHGPSLIDARVDPDGYPDIVKAVRG